MPDEAPTLDLSAFDLRPAWAKGPSDGGGAAAPRPPRDRAPEDRRGGKYAGRDRGRHPGKPGRKPFGNRRDEKPPPPPPNPFPWLRIGFGVTAPAVETVAQQVRHTGKTFGLFEIARILLRNPASYTIDLSAVAPSPAEPFFAVAADGSVWLSKAAAVQHILRTRLEEFYRAETVGVDPPKGNFPVVAVCGMSGTLIGPPNHHDYERRLRELHREKFSRMDFEQFRFRLKMERDAEVVEKWRAAASQVTVYHPSGVEGDAPKLDNLAAVEAHFLAHHADANVAACTSVSIPGDPRAAKVDAGLAPLIQHVRSEEERFPLRLARSLSRALTAAGLRFHKNANRTTYVSASRTRHLDPDQVAVSDSVRRILEAIRAKPGIRRPHLLDQLAPPVPAPVPAPAPTEGEVTGEVAEAAPPPPDPAREAVVQDLLWLTHEGYVIEYADGRLESVPPPKNPPKEAAASAGGVQEQQPEA